jgi:putative PEP-CTERM system TPR-repeat lipoprotein
MSSYRPGSALRRAAVFVTAGVFLAAAPALAGEAVEKARQHLEAGKSKAAIIELKNALQQDPGDATARLLLGELYLGLKDGAGAEKELLRAADLSADPAAWRLNLVEAMILQGKFSDALDRLDAAEPFQPEEESRALALRGQANLGLKQYDEADRYFDLAIRGDENNEKAALGKILLALARNELDKAESATDQFLPRFPNNVDALLISAELHRKNRETTKAAERFAQAMKLEPENFRAVLGHATVMIAADDIAQAKADLDRADGIQKDLVLTHYLRGVIAFRERTWDVATEHLHKVLSTAPDHLQSQLLMGVISFTKGNLQITEEYLSNVVNAMPTNAQAVKVLAATRIKQREPQKAIEVLEPFVRTAPDAQSMALLGSAYMLNGNQEKGQEWLTRAVDASPDVAALRTQLALTMLAGGETDKAITELQSAVDLGQDILQADVLLVLAHLKNKELDKALKASKALEQRMPDSAIAYNLTGLALLAQQDKEEARERFRKALELDPEFVTAALNLARIDIADDNLEGAQKQYELVLAKQPEHLGSMLGMAALAERRQDNIAMVSWLEKAQEANPNAVKPGLLLTKYHLSAKESLKALSVANNLSQRFPQNPQVLEMLARAQALVGESSNAMRTFEQLAQLRPEDAQLQYLLGGAKWKAEDIYGARDAFNKAISLKPDFVNARVALASLEVQDGRVGDALRIAQQLQQDFPDAAIGYQVEGRTYVNQDRPEDAIKAFETAYSKRKGAQIVRQLAQAYAAADRRGEAIKLLEDWLTEQPEDLGARGMLAMNYQLEGRDEDATKSYEAIAEVDPKNVVTLNNLAWLYQKIGDPRALETAKKAYDLDPERPEVADTYGWVLLQSGQVQEGLSALQQAYVAFPTQSEIGYHVAVGLNEAGRKDESIKVLRRLLRETPSFPKEQEAKALLEKLEQ